jgi:IS30 family transposase
MNASSVAGKKVDHVTEAIEFILKPIMCFVKMITFQDSKEFALHEKIVEKIKCNTYFAKS